MPEADRGEFLEGLGLHDSGLDRVIRAGYDLLGLITYFTVGPKETRAWTIVQGTKAPQAAGVIHGDFERGFIACETIAYDDYVAGNGEAGAQRGRAAARRGQGLCRAGRRRAAVPLQRVGAARMTESRVLHRFGAVPPIAAAGRGMRLVLPDGREIIDGAGGAAVACIGHGNARVAAAIGAQAGNSPTRTPARSAANPPRRWPIFCSPTNRAGWRARGSAPPARRAWRRR